MDKENFKASLQELIDKFERSEEYYKSKSYKEDELRQEFINPLFKALGWDMDNKAGVAPQYRDVIHEDRIEIEGKPKAPDYSFKIGPERKFFVEAKAASVKIISEFPPSFQLRRYAWSGKLPVSILTDFEEFSVYDSTIEPKQSDKTETARIKYIHYKDYLKEADYLWDTFSKDAVWKGSFDKFAKAEKRGNQLVDKSFLTEIETWRSLLAKDIATNNSDIDIYQLNEAVQKIIDRIIFLRIAEDRGIEFYENLKKTIESKDTYRLLVNIFKRAQDKYNSNLFDFNADSLTTKLKISDKVLDRIIGSLYYPKSPFEFSVIGVEILGSVYEQFLGKVIRLTKGHNAIIEEKPEVKKAGGVYYTPQYIVDYIVNNTVGELTNGKTPKEVSKLRIVDPACGSGSFLIGAYNFLLDWHLKYYIENDTEKHIKASTLFRDMEGNYFLSTAEKKRILLNNIYGVDIDSQAVEVTKLSLALKMMENENSETINKQLKLFAERILPDLGSNIKCGNSLIGSDYYSDKNLSLLSDEEIRKVNAFDWDKEFSEVFKQGGFDAVIGNPPYVDIKGMDNELVEYLFKKYKSANNRINLFSIFMEASLKYANDKFKFSMIVPSSVTSLSSYNKLREMILREYFINSIVRLPNESFGEKAGDVKVDTAIITISNRQKNTEDTKVIAYPGYVRITNINSSDAPISFNVNQNVWENSTDYVWNIHTQSSEHEIISKCEQDVTKLVDCTDFSLGITPYDKYKGHTKAQIDNRVFHSNTKENETFVKLLAGNDVKRYIVGWGGKEWISYGSWLGASRQKRFFTEPRILVKQIIDWTTKRIWATYTDEELYNTQNAFNLIAKREWDIFFLLGVLNSKLMSFYHRKKFLEGFKMRFQKILIKDCKEFPIKNVNEGNRDLVNQIAKESKELTSLHKELARVGTSDTKRSVLIKQITLRDEQIDRLVYKLYSLNEQEIAVIEKSI